MTTDAREHTPGTWEWSNATGEWMLVTPDRGRLVVLDFVRKGMQGAAPRVRDIDRCLMLDFDPDHPDARLIAAAPDLLAACGAAKAYSDACERMKAKDFEDDASKAMVRLDAMYEEWQAKLRAALSAATGEGGAG